MPSCINKGTVGSASAGVIALFLIMSFVAPEVDTTKADLKAHAESDGHKVTLERIIAMQKATDLIAQQGIATNQLALENNKLITKLLCLQFPAECIKS